MVQKEQTSYLDDTFFKSMSPGFGIRKMASLSEVYRLFPYHMCPWNDASTTGQPKKTTSFKMTI